MPRSTNLLFLIAQFMAEALAELSVLLGTENEILELLAEVGIDAPSPPSALVGLRHEVEKLIENLDVIFNLSNDELANQIDINEAYVELLTQIRQIFEKITNLKTSVLSDYPPDYVAATDIGDKLPERLVDYLLIRSLEYDYPEISSLLHLVGIITFIDMPSKPTENQPEFTLREVHWERFPIILQSPDKVFRLAFQWGMESFAWESLMEILSDFFHNIMIPASPIYLDENFKDFLREGTPEPGEEDVVALNVPVLNIEDSDIELGISVLPLIDTSAAPGLALVPYLTGVLDQDLELTNGYLVHFESTLKSLNHSGLIFRPDQSPKLLTDKTGEQGFLELNLESPEDGDGDYTLLLGDSTGNRLEYRHHIIRCGWNLLGKGLVDLYTEIEVQRARFVLPPDQGDSFIQELIPDNGLEVNFDLVLGISSNKGLYFGGSTNLETSVPTHASAGLLEVESLTIVINPNAETTSINTGASVSTHFGPIKATLTGIGLQVTFAFPGSNGNLGPLDLEIGLQPPTGLGLSINGEGFSGGGFLRYIETDQHYEGILELEYEDKITLKAIGLLTTHLPDNKPGYSLLIIITTEFAPIQLGLGFTLNGVGGLLGLNRTANAERLRSGLRDKTLNSVLFPQNVIENASRILSDLNQVFPVQADRFIFGPMARIGWGTPTLLTIDLGLLIEIPDPVRVLILGVIRALLPDQEAKLLQLQVNFLGVIDFDAQKLSIDASLYDSKLLTYTLSGDMAVRLNWGADSNFLLTVGGFHPAYNPPPLNLPKLRRLSLHLTTGDNPRLTLETYFAITSNTVQFGAKAELLAKAGSFNIYGYLSFDVLFQFSPFYFIAAISAKLALRSGSSEIAGIGLDFTLEGPTPWHAKGTAKLKICWFLTIKVHFDKTFGEQRDTRLDDVPVLPLLKAALSDKGNWEAHSPGNRHLLVSFKQIQAAGDQVMVYPFGVLTIQQKVVPLDIDIQRFGSQRPADGEHFAIEKVIVEKGNDAQELDKSSVNELFAPAQFFEMSDAEKLASKSFERYDSGVKLVDSEAFDGDYAVRREVAYELSYIDEQRTIIPRSDPLRPDLLAFEHRALKGAIANSSLSYARNGKSALAPGAVQVSQEAYAVVNASDLHLAEAGTLAESEAGAQRLMAGLIRDNPAREGEILVVPAFEVNQS